MIVNKTVCDFCLVELTKDDFVIELRRGEATAGPFKYTFRSEPISFSVSNKEGDAHFCGASCMISHFSRQAREEFVAWVNGRNDLKPDEIIGGCDDDEDDDPGEAVDYDQEPNTVTERTVD